MRIMQFAALAVLLNNVAPAQVPEVGAGRIERLEAFASQFVPARNVDVWLPDDYPAQAPYAVLYMHDGQQLFDAALTWNAQEWRADEVADELIRSGKTRPFIIVGVANGEPARHSEFFPQRAFALLDPAEQARMYTLKRGDDPLFARPVDSDHYLKFLATELKPYIDTHYAVAPGPEQTAIMGSSMGGLISMYALAEYPEVFGAAACLSTHWAGTVTADDHPAQEALLAWVERDFPQPRGQRIYMDRGDQTLDAWYPPLQTRVDALMRAKGYGRGDWLSLAFPGTEHSEKSWSARLHVPMQFLFPPP
jgi:predicted alpha/beta superfamily hydrolase